MTHPELVNVALSAHSAVFLAAAAAYYRYGDRTDLQHKTLTACDSALDRLCTRVASRLADHLRPLFGDRIAIPSLIVTPADGTTYTERPADPTASERYAESVRQFADQDVDAVADYSDLRRARLAWCRWARRLSWALLLLLGWQVLAAATLLSDKIALLTIEDHLVYHTFVPTTVLLLTIFSAAALLQRTHDRITDTMANYAL